MGMFLPWTTTHLHRLGLITLTTLLAACASSPPPSASDSGILSAPGSAPGATSQASDPKAYRRDAAAHLYARNAQRIYPGVLPPMLYAVGVVQVRLDSAGQVRSFQWLRAPRHAPEVMADIERTMRQAAPYPAPVRMGGVVYTETWLWDKSGRFQLDTLTEGQRSQ